MELQFFGGNCLALSSRKARIVVDDNLDKLGLKVITKDEDICLHTHREIPSHPCRFRATMPGEYEIAGAIIKGVAARAHIDEPAQNNAVIYIVQMEDIKVAILGHIYEELNEEQLEQIGLVDVAMVPVGGNGYTLDGVGALKVIKQIEPKAIIPTHYADKGVKYEVPQQELTEAVKGLGMEPSDTVEKYKPALADLTDTTHLIVLKRQ